MTVKQGFTPPVGTLVHSVATIQRWAIQFNGSNWLEMVEFLRFFQINWCMHRCGLVTDPDHFKVEDEDGIFHVIRVGEWIDVEDNVEERYISIFSNRYFMAHSIPVEINTSRTDA